MRGRRRRRRLEAAYNHDQIKGANMKSNPTCAAIYFAVFLIIVTGFCLPLSGEAGKLEKTIPLLDISKPDAIEVDAKQFYITQGFSIYIYSLTDFKLKKKFGRQGEGPGEFKGYILTYVQPDCIFVNSTNRVSYFSQDGKYQKEKNIKQVFGRFKPVGKTGFVGYFYNRQARTRTESVYLHDANFEKQKELAKREFIIDKSGKINLIEERPPWFYAKNGKIYVDSPDDVIHIFDQTGKEIKQIKFPEERIKVTGEHKKRVHHFLKTDPANRRYYERFKQRLIFPDTFPAIRMYHIDGGRIYIQTAREKDGKNEILVLDMNGKILDRLFIPIAPFEEQMVPMRYFIANGKLYTLFENEDEEEWELKVYRLF